MKKYLMTAAFLGLTLALSGCYGGEPGPYPSYGGSYYGPSSYYDQGAYFTFYGDDRDDDHPRWRHDDDDRWRR